MGECLAMYALNTLDVDSPSLLGDPVEELRSERRKSGVVGAGERAAGELRRAERKGDAAGEEGDGEGRVCGGGVSEEQREGEGKRTLGEERESGVVPKAVGVAREEGVKVEVDGRVGERGGERGGGGGREERRFRRHMLSAML